ncbi:hypothetical protein FOZ61_004550 [Perkinsus olseni]|uniref:Histidine kinase/HSP90-like ATPase domain-containing protein n=1 Tax=Perkinsus olseni TaxID=32597 RepID=A0A7J6LK74_PEROL|nr:hypothetical protein FOZ61_004550 [Perkinsus olseni]
MPLNSDNERPLLSSWFMKHGMSLCGSERVDNRSVFLVVKEILDNAIDACRHLKDPRTEPKVSVTLKSDFKLICSDLGGPGIAADGVDSIRGMFSSTKHADSGTGFSGKFGLGLKFVTFFLHQAGCAAIHFEVVTDEVRLVKFVLLVEDGGIKVGEVRIDKIDGDPGFTTRVSLPLDFRVLYSLEPTSDL